ncbi:hypothetical protein PLESTF_001031700 [Pleodorina starrii]|nr:hypothetical protein PLESTF_001031700 [Pleodorina starrii]
MKSRVAPAAAPASEVLVMAVAGWAVAAGGSVAKTVAAGGNCPDARSILDLSNVYRARHQAPPLAWSASLAASSTSYAAKLATTCQLIHSTDRSYGENLLSQMQYPHPDSTCTKAAQGWYSEVESYDFKTAQPFTDNWPKGIGHFTALVWVGTTSMGCGMSLKDYRVDIGNGRTVVGGCKVIVCRYQPPGNFATNAEFMRNGEAGRVGLPVGGIHSVGRSP